MHRCSLIFAPRYRAANDFSHFWDGPGKESFTARVAALSYRDSTRFFARPPPDILCTFDTAPPAWSPPAMMIMLTSA